MTEIDRTPNDLVKGNFVGRETPNDLINLPLLVWEIPTPMQMGLPSSPSSAALHGQETRLAPQSPDQSDNLDLGGMTREEYENIPIAGETVVRAQRGGGGSDSSLENGERSKTVSPENNRLEEQRKNAVTNSPNPSNSDAAKQTEPKTTAHDYSASEPPPLLEGKTAALAHGMVAGLFGIFIQGLFDFGAMFATIPEADVAAAREEFIDFEEASYLKALNEDEVWGTFGGAIGAFGPELIPLADSPLVRKGASFGANQARAVLKQRAKGFIVLPFPRGPIKPRLLRAVKRAGKQSWRDSERDVGDFLEASFKKSEWKPQVKFKDGRIVEGAGRPPKDSTVPDYHDEEIKVAVETKRYSEVASTADKQRILTQAGGRVANLPTGTEQWIIIDHRGMNLSDESLVKLYQEYYRSFDGTTVFEDILIITEKGVYEFW